MDAQVGGAKGLMNRKRLVFLAKLVFSVAVAGLIYGKVLSREGGAELWSHLADLSWGWIVAAVVMQLSAIACSILRWERLLIGQGLHAPRRHLVGSFMIGRFFGAFTPGGWTGLGGYRIYDIAKHTGKTARAAASIGVEMLLGQLAFGAVVIAGSLFGLEVIGKSGVLLVDGFFVVLICAAITLLSRPALFRKLGELAPGFVRARLQTALDAVCAYQGKGRLVAGAALLGMGTHTFNNLVFVCTAHALGVDLGPGQVFFVSAMQIFATLMPASVNGIGIREATAVALYTTVGVPAALALLIPTIGFAVEMFVSAFGGLVFLARRVGYQVEIKVDEPEREDMRSSEIERVSSELWPKLGRGAVVGLGGGLLGGLMLGVSEAAVVLAGASGQKDYSVLVYGGAAYGIVCAAAGLALGIVLAGSGRLMHRQAVAEPLAFARTAALVVALGAFALGAFRVRRDVFDEQLVWKSAQGLLVAGGCALAALVLYLVIASLLRVIVAHRPFSVLLRAWSSPLLLSLLLAGNLAFSLQHAAARPMVKLDARHRAPAPAQAGNVLFIVIDTLRADHLPLWGYRAIETPHLDALARDGVRFEHAFANASWTRPSFASMMTGRYPSSHQTTRKSDSLPSEIVTLAEALQHSGYATYGAVTNYNVAPFFNFQQGFDQYRYLEPKFVLGAGDTAAKLLLVQALRQGIETINAKRGRVEPGTAYQDATVVNRTFLQFLDAKPKAPWYAFVAYMDPHDPYFPHPYDGTGYARAAHQKPTPEELPLMTKLYDGEIAFWDQEFGKLVAELKRRGLYDSLTIVGFWHGTTLYDEQLHVPLLLKLPNNERGGSVVSHWVESIDIMPTLLARNGVAVPDGVQGKELMLGGDSVWAEEDHEGNVLRALRMRRGSSELKVIEANAGNPRGLLPFELYRVDQDAREMVDLSRQDAPLLNLAASRLDEHGRLAKSGHAQRKEVDVAADPSAVQKLRALGYAGGEDAKKQAQK
jgi:glycosyltransferase 2 family protein